MVTDSALSLYPERLYRIAKGNLRPLLIVLRQLSSCSNLNLNSLSSDMVT